MEFSDFARKLHGIIGAGGSTIAFTKSIIEAILSDEAPDITDEYSDDTFKAYFNGYTKIPRLAKKITAYIEPYNFAAYIDTFSDAVHDSLVESFSDILPNANSHNIGEQLAVLFASILKDAAMTKRKSPNEQGTKRTLSEDQQMIIDSLKKPLLTFAKAADALTHETAERIQQNSKRTSSPEDEPETITTEVEDDEKTSYASNADEEPIQADVFSNTGTKVQIITNPTIVNQNGEHNIHIDHVDVLNL